jgi:allophanate hydrolase
MKIVDIKSLLKSDFSVYKHLLLNNQKKILTKLKEECIFISVLEVDALKEKINAIVGLSEYDYPLLGVPFAVKDNIDVQGFNTTAGCDRYSYTPKESAFAVQLLEAAGAICIGKTNMDQFATGLVGTRSPHGIAKNYYNPEYIPGGSSSGSASAITAGYVPFSLGTDTAGSGRVPAAFQNLVGVKPTRGIVSNTGLVPACKSLDCISIFSTNVQDCSTVLNIISQYDRKDEYSKENYQLQYPSKIKLAIPLKENLIFFGNEEFENAFDNHIQKMKQCGYSIEELDFSPMFDAAKLLYDGPWVAERYHAVGAFIEQNKDAIFPTTKQIILGGKKATALEYFDAEYKLKKFQKVFEKYAKSFSAFLMPTVGTIYKIEDINKEPIRLNSNLGYYTNFMNLLDCAALALPVTITKDNIPFGITIFAPAFNDANLLKLSEDLLSKELLSWSDNIEYIDLAVCGAHKQNGSLNYQLTEINAVYKETTFTANDYRLFALEYLTPLRPGLIKDIEHGGKIEVEIWKVPTNKLGSFINKIDEPLCFGKVTLESGKKVTSFLCEAYAVKNAKEITYLQSWEKYLKSKI